MNLKSIAFILISAAFMLLLLSCGGTVSTPLTPEEALTKRAEALDLAGSREEWLKAYKYLSPRSREVCANADYAVYMGMGFAMLKGLMGIPEDEKFTISVLRVTVDGDIGRVYHEIKHDGEVLEFEENEGEGWVYVDGEWWQEEDDWETTCELF